MLIFLERKNFLLDISGTSLNRLTIPALVIVRISISLKGLWIPFDSTYTELLPFLFYGSPGAAYSTWHQGYMSGNAGESPPKKTLLIVLNAE